MQIFYMKQIFALLRILYDIYYLYYFYEWKSKESRIQKKSIKLKTNLYE